jgi:2-polyprenyl-3-methyl-5-hydroxy-6-metoxy-1,4-benzoquinol methylase
MRKYDTISKACDICGSSEYEVVNVGKKNGTATVIEDGPNLVHNVDVMCTKCTVVYKNPTMTRDSLDKFYKEEYSNLFRPGYNETISRSTVVYTMTSAIQVSDWVAQHMDVGKCRILDIGAGDGMFMKLLECSGAKVVGIDQDSRGAEIAKKLLGIDIIEGDIMKAEFEHKFDLVCLRNTLEHMYSPTEVLEKAKSLLADGGQILIEVPLAHRPYLACNVQAFLSAAHNYTFSLNSLVTLLEKVGLGLQEYSMEGHQGCCLVLASKEPSRILISDYEDYPTLLKEVYSEHDKVFFNKNEIIKELLASSNVNNSIGEILSYKYTSNYITFMLVTTLMGMPDKRDFLATIFDTYTWNNTQSFDINCCEASYGYLKAMFYRELGDFSTYKRVLKTAQSMYPSILSKNFVKELLLEGVLSESIFAEYLWYSCYKQCKIV